MFTNEESMARCLQLAQNGRGSVSPNPMVGCVIVKNGSIVGEGYHAKFGEAHAEVNAIRSVSASVEGAEVFVNLEPCSFYGKTPPCADLLIEKRVRKVYTAMLDPNPRISGNGVRKLREAGIEVEVGLASKQAGKLNEAFTKFIRKKIPFVTLKVAQSLDGKIALSNGQSPNGSLREKYITSKESLRRVHELRAEYDAVLIGAGTVKTDNPELTVRLVDGRSPIRIVIDGNLSVPADSKVFARGRVMVFYSSLMHHGRKKSRKAVVLEKRGVELFPMRSSSKGIIDLESVLKKLASLNIASILVEGGASVFSQFIESKLADKMHLFIAPKILGNGVTFTDGVELKELSKALRMKNIEASQIGDDYLLTGYF